MRGREKADIWVCTSPCGFMSALLAAVAAADLIKAVSEHCWRNYVVAVWSSCNGSISQPTETLKGGKEETTKELRIECWKISNGEDLDEQKVTVTSVFYRNRSPTLFFLSIA